MTRTTKFKTNMEASASTTKSLPLEEVIVGVLESDNEHNLSSFEEPKEEVGDFEDEDGNQKLFFHPTHPLPFQVLLTEEHLLIMTILNLKMSWYLFS